MQKIVVEKNEAVADLIERILESEAEQIVLVIPKKSHLLDSPNNFRLLAREGHTLGKTIEIESVDDNVLALAKEHGLVSTHPLFSTREEGGQPVSDIVHRGGKKKLVITKEDESEAVPLKVQREEEYSEETEEVIEERGSSEDEEAEEERYDTVQDYRETSSFGKIMGIIVGLLVLVALGMWAFGAFFGKAEVKITFKKTPFTFNDAVAALTSVKDIDTSRNLVPGQLFEQEKSLVQTFPATGTSNDASKAKGVITVVNNYGTSPQQLVATTRFETPDGKIFRLDSSIVVPAAASVNGKIEPASIKAPVTADQAGTVGNVGRVEKLTIPGFKSDEGRYAGFYGVLENGATGGATGARRVATDADVDAAKGKIAETLRSAFQTTFLSSVPSDIKILDGASSLTLGPVAVNRNADETGSFSLTGNAVFDAFGFREKDIAALLNTASGISGQDMKINEVSLSYSDIKSDFLKKELKFTLAAAGNMVPNFDPEAFKMEIAGQKKDDARASIEALPQLESAEVKLWPAWVRSVPKNQEKINITVD
jgi:hypothetical protein